MLERRDDIDGLRAIAVVSVVIFHAFPETKFGGFIGVDVFFVISGYLITGIIYRALLEGNFSFQDFYSRRIRRIFPALAIVLIGSMAIAWFILFSFEARTFAKEVLAGVSFLSNFLYWSQASYFDVSADQKPLLHLWSLAIEEQYYLLAPALLWVSFRLRLNLITLTCICILASFTVGIHLTKTNPTAAFYAPWSRAWELYAGSLLALLTVRPPAALAKLEKPISTFLDRLIFSGQPVYATSHLRVAASVAGAACIIIGFIVVRPGHSFPGWFALLPVMGTLCLIFAGPQTWLNRKILSHPVMVGIGLISYPLYLWHWPLLSFAQIGSVDPVSATTRAALVALSIVLAAATYLLVERPFRFRLSPRPAVAILVAAMILAAGTAGSVLQFNYPSRFKEREAYLSYFEDAIWLAKTRADERATIAQNQCNFYQWDTKWPSNNARASIDPSCYTKRSERSVLLWGDSTAAHLLPGLQASLPSNITPLLIHSSGCRPRPLVPQNIHLDHCEYQNAFTISFVEREKPDIVVMASNNSFDIAFVREISERFRRFGVKHVIVVGNLPHWKPYLHKLIARGYWDHTGDRIKGHQDMEIKALDDAFISALRKDEPFQFIDLSKAFCNDAGCLTYLNGNRMDGLVTMDTVHLRPFASEYVAKNLLAPAIMAKFKGNNNQPASD